MKKIVHTNKAPKALGPYSRAVESNNFLFLSGQVPINPSTGKLIEGTIEEMTHQVMKNLNAIILEAGLDFSKVVKTTIFCTDLGDFGKINQTYGSYFTDSFPARATIQVAALPLNVRIEIEMVVERS